MRGQLDSTAVSPPTGGSIKDLAEYGPFQRAPSLASFRLTYLPLISIDGFVEKVFGGRTGRATRDFKKHHRLTWEFGERAECFCDGHLGT